MNAECCPQSGQAGFYSVLLLDYLFCCWLASRACRRGQVNHYRLLVRCKEHRAEVDLLCGEAATGHMGIPTNVMCWIQFFFFSVNFIKVQMHVAAQILAFFLCAFIISHHFPCFLATLSDLLNNLMYHFTDI